MRLGTHCAHTQTPHAAADPRSCESFISLVPVSVRLTSAALGAPTRRCLARCLTFHATGRREWPGPRWWRSSRARIRERTATAAESPATAEFRETAAEWPDACRASGAGSSKYRVGRQATTGLAGAP
eukprot:364685-Chlamydomonas_euryale.AAC.6